MPPLTTQPRGQATRAEIINVARRLFSQHGYHSTGLSDIQEATGLTKGAFYHHFRSKEELAHAVLEAARADYAEQWIGPGMRETTPGRRINALLDRAIVLNTQPEWCNCQMMVTLCAELTTADDKLLDAVQTMQIGMFELWRDLIAEAKKSGEVRESIEPDLFAQWICNTILGGILVRKLGSTQIHPAKLIEEMKLLLFI